MSLVRYVCDGSGAKDVVCVFETASVFMVHLPHVRDQPDHSGKQHARNHMHLLC